ncbi:alpha carbonic anhydrase 8-like [Impatiens glandulifera]|uniref:alpha carbonic anhydrase 8-like n=1 Tax=Impatiens glandulifera TaxID=253017 RepID=UPI001FB10B99|nr:alpha carbonic anhydrase 8-like [Impatiens glandulifera]
MMSNTSSSALVFSLLALYFTVSVTALTSNTSDHHLGTVCGEKQLPKPTTPHVVPLAPHPKQKPAPLTAQHKPKPSVEPSKVVKLMPSKEKPTQATSKVNLTPKRNPTPAPTTVQHHNESPNVKLSPKKNPRVVSLKNNLDSSCPHGVPSKAVKAKSSDRVIPSSRKQMHNPDSALYITANSESAS